MAEGLLSKPVMDTNDKNDDCPEECYICRTKYKNSYWKYGRHTKRDKKNKTYLAH